jgi:succinoglycan biosynthesis protein ExoO
MARPRTILVLTRHTPLPWEDGAGAYLFSLIRHLHTEGFRVHLGWLAPHDHLRWQGVWTLPADFAAVATLHTPGGWRLGRRQFYPAIYWLPFKARLLHLLKHALQTVGLRVGHRGVPGSALASSTPPQTRPWMDTPSAAESAFAAALVRRVRPETLIVNYAWLTPLFDTLPTGRPAHRVCLHPDVAWHRAAIQAALDHAVPEITPETEASLLRRAGLVVGISETDAGELRQLVPTTDLVVAPKAVDPQPLPASAGERLLFVGSNNSFNVEGLAWFLREVWPLIRAARPAATLDVCGSIDHAVADRPAGACFHGAVPDLTACYAAAAVVVVPLRNATGLNIKLVDAAARGRAIVTTPATLAGAPFLAAEVAAEDSPAGFAAAVLHLLEEPAAAAEAGRRALVAVRERLSPAACYGAVVARLRAAPA